MSTSTYDVLNPATEEVIETVPLATLAETDRAIEKAAAAFETWRNVSPADRALLLRRFAAAVDADLENLAQLEVVNAGHTIGNARWEAGNVRDVLAYYSGAPERHMGQQIPVAGGVNVTFNEPLGVVGVIVPWNFPMPIAAWGFAPALAAGNTVVLKPAELTPLTALRLGQLAREAGLPDGVLQIIPGKGSVVGERFVTHPAVRKVVFTGSTGVGKRIMAGCAEQVKPVTLELGGKSANIIFADADLEAAAAAAPGGAFDNAGQDCCSRSRILVQHDVFERFLELLEPAVKALKVGDPGDEDSFMGPLISAAQHRTVAGFVPDGAPIAFQGSAPDRQGILVPAHRPDSVPRGPGDAGGDLRPGRGSSPLQGRSRRAPPGQRHHLRPVRLHLDQGHRTGPARCPRTGIRKPLRQLPLIRQVLHALWRIQAVGPGP